MTGDTSSGRRAKIACPLGPATSTPDQEFTISGRCEKGDRVVIVAGSPPGRPGRTSALRVHTIGDAAALGAGLA